MRLITELKQIESDYKGGTIEITNGLPFSEAQTLRMVEFYTNSKFLNTGDERPFYNVVNTMVDTAVVATDIDTKDIRVEAEREQDYDKSFLFNHEIQNWMKESNFAEELNEMGETRARYGGVVVKKCKEDGKMEIEVVDWKNLVSDPVCFDDGIVIEKHYMTPNELRKKGDVWNNVDEAIKLWAKKGYTRTDTRMEIWEVHGEFADVYLDDEVEATGDEKDYSNQVHFFAVNGNKTVHLYWAEEKEEDFPYKYLPWKRANGRKLGRGVVEEGEEAQVWTNDAVQKEQSYMEWASKVFFKGNSKKVGDNMKTDHKNGDYFYLEDGKDMNVMNLTTGVQPQFEVMKQTWWSQYERVTSSYDAQRGETPPSGQPYRLQALVANASGSHFDYRREEWGIFLTEIFYDWVFPYIEKKMNKAHILASDFSPEELARLDEHYSKYQASEFAKEQILSGTVITLEDYQSIQDQFSELIGKTGKRRFLDIPENYYKDMKAKLTINITGEQKNKMAALESLNSMLQQMLPLVQAGIVTNQDVQMVLNKIMELSGAGISPLSLSKSNQQTQQGVAPQQAMPQSQPLPAQPITA